MIVTRTLTALYTDEATAERAMERLRAVGVPEASMEMHRETGGDILPGQQPAPGLFAIGGLLAPGAGNGIEAHGATVVASGVPEELADRALAILREDSIDAENGRDAR